MADGGSHSEHVVPPFGDSVGADAMAEQLGGGARIGRSDAMKRWILSICCGYSKLFSQASGGSTLHQRRHSALTHLGEEGVSAVLLLAKSRHQDPRTLARCGRPGSKPWPP